MLKTELVKILDILKCQSNKEDKFNKLFGGIPITEFNENYHTIINTLLKNVYNKVVLDDIEWWLYENVEKVVTLKDKSINLEKTVDYVNFLYDEYKLDE